MGLLQRCLLLVTLAVVFFTMACETKHMTDMDEVVNNKQQDKTTYYGCYYGGGYYYHKDVRYQIYDTTCTRYNYAYICDNGEWLYCYVYTSSCRDEAGSPDEGGSDLSLREDEFPKCVNPDGDHLDSITVENGTIITCLEGNWY